MIAFHFGEPDSGLPGQKRISNEEHYGQQSIKHHFQAQTQKILFKTVARQVWLLSTSGLFFFFFKEFQSFALNIQSPHQVSNEVTGKDLEGRYTEIFMLHGFPE